LDEFVRSRKRPAEAPRHIVQEKSDGSSPPIRSLGLSIATMLPGATERVNQTFEPMIESWPTTVLPPRIVALA
jgi:hypothetical protein